MKRQKKQLRVYGRWTWRERLAAGVLVFFIVVSVLTVYGAAIGWWDAPEIRDQPPHTLHHR
ncbi:MAG: hypothetical protein RH917_14560 [Lacipirellulaceae bacterium]